MMKKNLLHTLDGLLDDLMDKCYLYQETLIHAETSIPVAVFTSRESQQTIQLAIHGVWQMTCAGESVAAYIGGINKDGQLLKKLKQIEGQPVTEVIFFPEKLHLFLELNDEFWLRLFCSPLRHEAYYVTIKAPGYDEARQPVCQATRYCVYSKGVVRARWDE